MRLPARNPPSARGSTARRLLRRTTDPLRDELAISWRALLLIGGLAAAGLAAVVPVLSLRRPENATGTALSLETMPPIGPVVAWTAEVVGPSGTRDAALGQLFAVLVAVTWAVLAIASVAILGRLVAQAYERAPEIGIRRAVGARRSDILLTQLGEAALATAGVLLVALPLGYAALAAARVAWPGSVAPGTGGAGAAIAIVASVLAFGAVLPLAHRSARRLHGGDPMPVTLGVPALQIGASIAVLTAAALMLRHAGEIRVGGPQLSPGEGRVWAVDASASDAARRAAAYESLLARLASDPRYDVASLTSRGMHSGLGTVDFGVTDCGFCVRGMIVMRWLHLSATHHTITPDTFTAAGIRVVSGRGFALTDSWNAPRVAVVNRHLAARYFEPAGAVGRDIYVGSAWPKVPHRVVGIVDDERPPVLGGAVQPRETVYLSGLQHPPASVELVVRPARANDPPESGVAVERLLREELGAAAGIERAGTERDRAVADAAPLTWFGYWFGMAGVAALLIALMATSDTVGLWVRSIAGELAMHRATGATRRQIRRFVAVRVATAVAAGGLIGVLLFVTLIREYLVRSVPHLPTGDSAVALAATVVLLLAALGSAAAATRRFLRTAPARWLR